MNYLTSSDDSFSNIRYNTPAISRIRESVPLIFQPFLPFPSYFECRSQAQMASRMATVSLTVSKLTNEGWNAILFFFCCSSSSFMAMVWSQLRFELKIVCFWLGSDKYWRLLVAICMQIAHQCFLHVLSFIPRDMQRILRCSSHAIHSKSTIHRAINRNQTSLPIKIHLNRPNG